MWRSGPWEHGVVQIDCNPGYSSEDDTHHLLEAVGGKAKSKSHVCVSEHTSVCDEGLCGLSGGVPEDNPDAGGAL
jgi:hypothetical protein